MQKSAAMSRLNAKLNSLANKDELIRMFNIQEEKSDEFWRIQCFTVINRFFTYILHHAGLPLTTNREALSDEDCELFYVKAENYMSNGLSYKEVRDWWLLKGSFLHKEAYTAKYEAEDLLTRRLVVLMFFETGRPYYLAFDEAGEPVLKENAEDAYQFPVVRVGQLEKRYLEEAVENFKVAQERVGAVKVKVLPYKV